MIVVPSLTGKRSINCNITAKHPKERRKRVEAI